MKNQLTFNDHLEKDSSTKHQPFPDTGEQLEDQYEHETIIHQVNSHCYIVSLNKLDQHAKYHADKSTLTDIHKNFNYNKKSLVNNQGAVHIKEFTLDRYKCRCHTKTIDSKTELLNFDKAFI